MTTEERSSIFKNGMRPVHPGEILREDYADTAMRVAEIAIARKIEQEIEPRKAA